MKVTISVAGRFHAFSLAHELETRGHLERLISSYPRKEIQKYGIPRSKTSSILRKEIIQRGWSKLPSVVNRLYDPQYAIHNLYDKRAARYIEPTDIFVGWSSFALHSLRIARKKGATIVLERGSSHIEHQKEVLEREYAEFGKEHAVVHPKILEKELQEYRETDYISVPSKYVKRTFTERGFDEKKLIHVPYGVDLSQFKQIKKTDGAFRIVFAGKLSIRKGVHHLLRAFAELNLPNTELFMLGSMTSEMKPYAKQYSKNVVFAGRKPQNELYKYYSQGSVFVMPSIEEGLAMVQPQAMACGLPLICTTNTGGDDLIRDGKEGFVIPIRDREALKEKILYLYENQEKAARMGEQAKKRVSSGFTWSDYGDRMTSAYSNIL